MAIDVEQREAGAPPDHVPVPGFLENVRGALLLIALERGPWLNSEIAGAQLVIVPKLIGKHVTLNDAFADDGDPVGDGERKGQVLLDQ